MAWLSPEHLVTPERIREEMNRTYPLDSEEISKETTPIMAKQSELEHASAAVVSATAEVRAARELELAARKKLADAAKRVAELAK